MHFRYALFALALCVAGSSAAQTPLWAPASRPAVSPTAMPAWLAGRLPHGGTPTAPAAARLSAVQFETYTGTRHSLGRLTLPFSFVGFLTAADLDADGREDLVVFDLGATEYGIPRQVSVYTPGDAVGGGIGYGPSKLLAGLNVATWVGPPAFLDLDLDGDLDLVVSTGSLTDPAPPLTYYENTGSRQVPQFTRRSTSAVTGLRGFAFAADLDGDGRTDLSVTRLVADSASCSATFHRNVGAAGVPALAAADASMYPATLPSCALSFLDGDMDGDLDAAVTLGEAVHYLRNDGSVSAPTFVSAASPFADPQSFFTTGAALDVDADGLSDLVIVRLDEDGPRFEVYRHETASTFAAQRPDAFRTSLGVYEFGNGSFADLDGDGDLDLAVGGSASGWGGENVELVVFRNVGTSATPRFVAWADSPVSGIGLLGDLPQPAFADLDGDGLTDLTVTFADDSVAPTAFFKNVGTAAAPVFASRPSPFAAFPAAQALNLSFGDVDGDGDLDAAMVGLYTDSVALIYAENVGTPTAPVFAYRTGAASPLPAMPGEHVYLPTLTDLDGDDRPDLVVADLVQSGEVNADGSLRTFSNVGGTFEAVSVSALEGFVGFGLVGVAAADLTGDGRVDLLVSSQAADFFDVEVYWTLFSSVSKPLASGPSPVAAGALRLRHAAAHPARSTARVEIDGAVGARTVEVIDVLGRVVARVEDAPPVVAFAVGTWAPGRYAVRVRAGDASAVLPLTVVR